MTFDLETGLALALENGGFIEAGDPDVSAFKARRRQAAPVPRMGRPGAGPDHTIDDCEAVTQTPGGSQDDWMRLFLMPGVGHCGGGWGPTRLISLGRSSDGSRTAWRPTSSGERVTRTIHDAREKRPGARASRADGHNREMPAAARPVDRASGADRACRSGAAVLRGRGESFSPVSEVPHVQPRLRPNGAEARWHENARGSFGPLSAAAGSNRRNRIAAAHDKGFVASGRLAGVCCTSGVSFTGAARRRSGRRHADGPATLSSRA
jgi:hypothetical protein